MKKEITDFNGSYTCVKTDILDAVFKSKVNVSLISTKVFSDKYNDLYFEQT